MFHEYQKMLGNHCLQSNRKNSCSKKLTLLLINAMEVHLQKTLDAYQIMVDEPTNQLNRKCLGINY
jgi:hypothetical protein